ncbi:zinc ribbon domain-containing protein [Nitrososphaera sp.]|uniref:zinc ribbon domain-containing protein n=1 Tax=Nitrososphaera sp. TaxID=1971748 RepID=UPI001830FBAE|nr:zinc ribbon domain-containing protein [Nitrososphaera sp.]NWG36017.1 zinc ribbon domain-containing protein [Nitrososphaera sp.]
MPTRGTITVHAPKEAAYDALLQACRDVDAKVKIADRDTFTIDGDSGTMWLQNRFSFRFHARLLDRYDGVIVEAFDFSDKEPDRRFLEKLFEKLGKRVEVFTPEYAVVEYMESAQQPASSSATPLGQDAPAPLKDTLDIPRPGRLMVNEDKVPKPAFSIKAYGGGNEGGADKLIIIPIEIGNKLLFVNGKNLYLEIPTGSITSVEKYSETEKGFTGAKKNSKILISYDDGNPNSVAFDVDDDKVDELVNEIDFMRLYERQYFDAIDFEYRQGNEWHKSKLYPRTLYLAGGEQVLWMDDGSSWLGFGSYKWVKALTNFRVFFYDFKLHQCNSLSLPLVESVVVNNKRRESRFQHQGETRSRTGGGHYSYSYSQGSGQSESVTIGDVLFMHAGKPMVTFEGIEDPDGMAQMARSAIDQSKKNTRATGTAAQKTATLPSQPEGIQCKKCQSYNPEGSAFCNSCGERMNFVCGRCRHENPDGSRFCNQCGQAL